MIGLSIHVRDVDIENSVGAMSIRSTEKVATPSPFQAFG
jgi:hypothetical protein